MSASDATITAANTFPELSANHLKWLLVGLAAAAGMEFYTFDRAYFAREVL